MESDKVEKCFTELTRGKGTRFIPSFRRSLRTLLKWLNTHAPGIAYPLSWPGNLRLVLTPHMTLAMSYSRNWTMATDIKVVRLTWFRSLYPGLLILRVRTAISYLISSGFSSLNRSGDSHKASLSIQIVRSQLSTSWCTERRELYGWRWSATNQAGNESYILLQRQSRRPASQY